MFAAVPGRQPVRGVSESGSSQRRLGISTSHTGVGAHPHHVRSNLAPSLRMLSVKPYGPFLCGEKRSFRGDEQVQLKWLSSG